MDRASREIKSESLIEFCRGVLLKRADEILEAKRKSSYPKVATPAAKVADRLKPDEA